jgi:hypothetical protein
MTQAEVEARFRALEYGSSVEPSGSSGTAVDHELLELKQKLRVRE